MVPGTVLKWMFISSTTIWVTGSELEMNWLDQNVNEQEFELSRM